MPINYPEERRKGEFARAMVLNRKYYFWTSLLLLWISRQKSHF